MEKHILILGGYGNAGSLIAKFMLKERNGRIVLAGRNGLKAEQAAALLNDELHTNRVAGQQLDASNKESLGHALKDVAIVVVASSTIEYTRTIVEAALQTGVDYFDAQISSQAKRDVLESFRGRIRDEGRCFITDGGFRPGIPAAMVRYAATQLPQLEAANVGSVFQVNWKEREFASSTAGEFVDELKSYSMLVLKNRQWVQGKMSQVPQFDFGTPFGKKYCTPMFMEEFRVLPDAIPTLKETGFYSAGFGWMVDYVIIPVSLLLVKLRPDKSRSLIAKMFTWGLNNWTNPPYGAALQMNANGSAASMQMTVSHSDAYYLTAASAAACLMQYCDGGVKQPGLWFQADVVEPIQFFRDMEQLGVTVQVTPQRVFA